MVSGFPAAICCCSRGTSDPLEPSTLPNRTVMKRGLSGSHCPIRSSAWQYSSPRRLVAPMTPTGLTALSVDT